MLLGLFQRLIAFISATSFTINVMIARFFTIRILLSFLPPTNQLSHGKSVTVRRVRQPKQPLGCGTAVVYHPPKDFVHLRSQSMCGQGMHTPYIQELGTSKIQPRFQEDKASTLVECVPRIWPYLNWGKYNLTHKLTIWRTMGQDVLMLWYLQYHVHWLLRCDERPTAQYETVPSCTNMFLEAGPPSPARFQPHQSAPAAYETISIWDRNLQPSCVVAPRGKSHWDILPKPIEEWS